MKKKNAESKISHFRGTTNLARIIRQYVSHVNMKNRISESKNAFSDGINLARLVRKYLAKYNKQES